MNLIETTEHLKNKNDLSIAEMEHAFAEIFSGIPQNENVRAFLVALYEKGETCDEILGAVSYLKKNGRSIQCRSTDLVDCCGTGGDKKNTFNISTAVAFVLAGAGCHVAKHGNRAVSSNCGSADILTELGVNISADEKVMAECIDHVGIGFLFAPSFYPLMKKVSDVRQTIPHRTIFNIIGPLLNPAGAKRQLIGVFDVSLIQTVTEVLKNLGSESVIAVHADNGMDEISLSCLNQISRLKDGQMTSLVFDPRESGYSFCDEKDLTGGTPRENALRLKQCLKGHSQPLDHAVHINAAWALIAAGKTDSFMEGLLIAQDSISSGRAYQKLEQLIEATS